MRRPKFKLTFALPLLLAVLLAPWAALPLARRATAATAPEQTDNTLRAMQDEMARSKDRLAMPNLEKTYYIEYRLLDLDVHTVRSSFGTLISSNTTRSRFMQVNVRIGDYHLDS